jgi:hypothetical protein
MVLIVAVMLCITSARPHARGQSAAPAGSTGAVLSFIDAAAGRVEVVRHWPDAPIDVDVYPFVPYSWDGCLGPGAIMILVTGPALPAVPPVPDATDAFGVLVAGALQRPVATAGEAVQLRRLAALLRMPGDPLRAAVAALGAPLADLGSYERYGYAVFAFITWQGWRCGVTLRAVPEGYGIPFVR